MPPSVNFISIEINSPHSLEMDALVENLAQNTNLLGVEIDVWLKLHLLFTVYHSPFKVYNTQDFGNTFPFHRFLAISPCEKFSVSCKGKEYLESYKAIDAMFGSLKRNTTLKRLEVRMVGTSVFEALSFYLTYLLQKGLSCHCLQKWIQFLQCSWLFEGKQHIDFSWAICTLISLFPSVFFLIDKFID